MGEEPTIREASEDVLTRVFEAGGDISAGCETCEFTANDSNDGGGGAGKVGWIGAEVVRLEVEVEDWIEVESVGGGGAGKTGSVFSTGNVGGGGAGNVGGGGAGYVGGGGAGNMGGAGAGKVGRDTEDALGMPDGVRVVGVERGGPIAPEDPNLILKFGFELGGGIVGLSNAGVAESGPEAMVVRGLRITFNGGGRVTSGLMRAGGSGTGGAGAGEACIIEPPAANAAKDGGGARGGALVEGGVGFTSVDDTQAALGPPIPFACTAFMVFSERSHCLSNITFMGSA